MRFTDTPIAGLVVIDPEPRRDERGSFSRLWCQREFDERGLSARFVQANTSVSVHKATLRGLHYQVPPAAEAKLIRCVRGRIFDVAVDMRPDSSTFLQWFGTELSAANGRLFFVPEGLAHGYLTLDDDTEVSYPASSFYTPEAERGVRWDDHRIAIAWPVPPAHVSPKDQAWPDVTDTPRDPS